MVVDQSWSGVGWGRASEPFYLVQGSLTGVEYIDNILRPLILSGHLTRRRSSGRHRQTAQGQGRHYFLQQLQVNPMD